MTRAIFVSGGRGRAMLRYMLGRKVDERNTKTLRTRALEQGSKEVGVQTEASKVMVGGCTGLDGDMLVLRQAASRRCGRAIVDADAGCKCLAQEMGVPWCVYAPHHARGRRLCCVRQQQVTDGGKGDRDLLR